MEVDAADNRFVTITIKYHNRRASIDQGRFKKPERTLSEQNIKFSPNESPDQKQNDVDPLKNNFS